MSRRTQFTLSEHQYALLRVESHRSGLSMAELVRRAIDTAYRPRRRPSVHGFEVNVGLWRRPDVAVVGRMEPRRGRSPLDEREQQVSVRPRTPASRADSHPP